jgi:protease IV
MAMSRGRKVALIIGGILLALVLLVVVVGVLLVMSLRNEPEIRDKSVLVIKVEGMLPDYSNADPVAARFFGAETDSLASLLLQLRKAKADKRVGAVLLDIGFLQTGWAKADEIRAAVADFRASGKPIYSYMEIGSDKEYYVATAAERVYMAPISDLFINGLAAEAMFFRGSFDKLGIEWDSFQIGRYKSAPEHFTRKTMSEGERENLNSLLDEIYKRYLATAAGARGKSVEDFEAMVNTAPHNAHEALAAGLIDATSYREEIENELKKRLGYKDDEKLRKVSMAQYRRVTPESLGLNEGEKIAVVFTAGPIGQGSSNDGTFGGEPTIGSDTVVKAINEARDDKGVKAIVLRVDSPGGSIYPSDFIWKAVEEAKRKKPVVVSMGDVAASGGYYISMGANKIVAEPLTLTGSIGIYAYKPVMSGFYEWIGVTSEYLMRGKNAGLFRETEKFTPEERERFEAMLKHAYFDEFVKKAGQGRGRDPEYIHSVGEGRVWTGAQAKEKGLVDELGGLDRAVEIAKDLAGIPADKGVRRVVFPAPRSFFEQMFGGGEDQAAVKAREQQAALINAAPREMRRALRYAAIFDRVRPGEAMAILPYDLKIE